MHATQLSITEAGQLYAFCSCVLESLMCCANSLVPVTHVVADNIANLTLRYGASLHGRNPMHSTHVNTWTKENKLASYPDPNVIA